MPIKNTVKQYDTPAYYHVYNRGAGGLEIFRDNQDRAKFLSLFARHLDPNNASLNANCMLYKKYPLELVAYCLMGNHFHLLVYQELDPLALTNFMRSVATAYTMYFNRKYKRQGHLFQSIFKASRITEEGYLLHVTRYIHMNPRNYLRYPWSSIGYYLGKAAPAWCHPERANVMTPLQYREFICNYEGRKAELELLKNELAL